MSTPLVLLVEDDYRLCDTISDLLQLLEIEYRVTQNATNSLASLIALKPDLILLDLPACRRGDHNIVTDIRLDFRLRQTKLVLIADDEYPDAPKVRVADAVLKKPFLVGELESVLRRLLSQYHHSEVMPPSATFAPHA